MDCNCGAMTELKLVLEDDIEVGSYHECMTCGRIEWIIKPDSVIRKQREAREKKYADVNALICRRVAPGPDQEGRDRERLSETHQSLVTDRANRLKSD